MTVESEQPAIKRDTILVVEDEELQAALLMTLLQEHNYDARAVSSGQEALEYLSVQSTDLLLVDMNLGHGMDGFETFMRAKVVRPAQKAIMVSGNWGGGFPPEIRECGFDAFIPKPFTAQELLDSIRCVMEAGEDAGVNDQSK